MRRPAAKKGRLAVWAAIALSAAAGAAELPVWDGVGGEVGRRTLGAAAEVLRTRGHVLRTVPTGELPAEAPVVLALGPEAAAAVARSPPQRPMLLALVRRTTAQSLRARLPPGYPMRIIVSEPPPARLFRLAVLALPGRRHVGVLLGPATRTRAAEVAAAARTVGIEPVISELADAAGLIVSLDALLPRVSALAAIPDPDVINRVSIRPLLLRSYRAGVPVIGYSRALVRAGAVVGVFSTPEQIGRQLARRALEVLAGRPWPPGIEPPEEFDVAVNPYVARSLGIALRSREELARELRAWEERAR